MPNARAIRTARRFELGTILAYLRTRAGLVQPDLARAISKPTPKIAAVEAGEGTVTAEQFEIICDVLRVTDAERVTLRQIHAEAAKRGEWVSHPGFHKDFRFMADLERHATLLREVELGIIPGLLQSEGYIARLFAGNESARLQANAETHRRGRNPVREQQQKITARISRAQLLLGNNAPEYRAVLHESSFHCTWGCSRAEMAEAIRHVIDVSRLPGVTVQLMPFTSSRQMRSGFTVARLPSRGIVGPLEIALTQNYNLLNYSDDPAVLENYDTAWAALTSSALDPDDTRKSLDKLARGYNRK